MNEAEKGRKLLAGLLISIIALGVFGLIFALTMFYAVGVGEVALIIDPLAKTVSDPVVGPVWSAKAPWTTIKIIYYATDKYEDTIPCFTADQLEMQVLIQIRWNLNISRIRSLYLSYPSLNYKSAIESITEQIMKTITKDYNALETISNRAEVISRIQDSVLNGLKEAPSLEGALASLEFNLRDIGYPKAYTDAIEAKLVAEQQKIQATFERERILILANATAQEAIIKARGEAEAKIIVAEGTKEAIQKIMESAGVTNSTAITELYLWTETLKQLNVSTFIIVTGPSGVPIIYQIPGNSTQTP